METELFNNVREFKNTLKKGDILIFGGYGIIDGLKNPTKENTYKFLNLNEQGDLRLKGYRQRNISILPNNKQDQKFMRISSKYFKTL